MNAKLKVTHLITTVIIEKCTTQVKSGILRAWPTCHISANPVY